MLKKLLTTLNLFAFITVFSQSGIGTHTPEGALDINSPNNDWGLVLPHVDEAENTKNPTGKSVKKGTMVYDLKENCIKYFNGNEWSGCLSAPVANPIMLECSSAVLNRDIVASYPVSAQTTVSIPYSNKGAVFDYEDTVIVSKNVTGLTAILPSGSIKKGAGNLVFFISGTPSNTGEAKFSLSIAGVTCEFVITVKNYTDIEAPAITNLICDQNIQLGYTTLNGKQMINGKEVIVNYSGSNIGSLPGTYTYCNATISDGIWLGNKSFTTLIITFSRPVTNVGMAFNGADPGEEFTFLTNNSQPIQINSNSSCQDGITMMGNKMIIKGAKALGGNVTTGGVWFTELTIQHNGRGGGSRVGFCLNGSDGL